MGQSLRDLLIKDGELASVLNKNSHSNCNGEMCLVQQCNRLCLEKDVLDLALAVILLKMGKCDRHLSESELIEIINLLKKALSLGAKEVLTLLERAEIYVKANSDISVLFKRLRFNLTKDHLKKIYSLAWRVGFTDGKVASEEESWAEEMRIHFGFTLIEALEIKRLAEEVSYMIEDDLTFKFKK
jgi:uncharacterized tellurite resistance protein B-like protein